MYKAWQAHQRHRRRSNALANHGVMSVFFAAQCRKKIDVKQQKLDGIATVSSPALSWGASGVFYILLVGSFNSVRVLER